MYDNQVEVKGRLGKLLLSKRTNERVDRNLVVRFSTLLNINNLTLERFFYIGLNISKLNRTIKNLTVQTVKGSLPVVFQKEL